MKGTLLFLFLGIQYKVETKWKSFKICPYIYMSKLNYYTGTNSIFKNWNCILLSDSVVSLNFQALYPVNKKIGYNQLIPTFQPCNKCDIRNHFRWLKLFFDFSSNKYVSVMNCFLQRLMWRWICYFHTTLSLSIQYKVETE